MTSKPGVILVVLLTTLPLFTDAFLLSSTSIPTRTRIQQIHPSFSISTHTRKRISVLLHAQQKKSPRFSQKAHSKNKNADSTEWSNNERSRQSQNSNSYGRQQQPPFPRQRKKNTSQQRQPWQTGKSIEELEGIMTKRWGTMDRPTTNKNMGGIQQRRKPVPDPWAVNEDENDVAFSDDTQSLNTNDAVIAFAITDVTSPKEVTKALDLAETIFGCSVNAAVNCAGVAAAAKTLSRKKDEAHLFRPHEMDIFSNVMNTNVMGTFNLSRLAAERMASQSPTQPDGLRGCIINTASIAAFDGQKGQVAYATSKSAIVGMTLPMARDLAEHNIRVMTIAPGLFDTALLSALPAKVKEDLGASVPCPSRLGNPDEFGKLVVTILDNPMLNGEVIRLDGGMRMPP